MLESYEWNRPEGLWLLALPLLLLLLLRLSTRPPTLATGTLEIWKQIAASGQSDGRRPSRRIALSIWILLLGLCAGAIAVADPRPVEPPRVRSFVCIVDASPSMYLPSETTTRVERAGALAREWLDENAQEGDEILWQREVNGRRELVKSPELPKPWLTRPRAAQSAPRWSDHDQPGKLWLTDAAPVRLGGAAVLIATGGDAVPGPVATHGETRFDWNGTSVERVEGGARRGTIRWGEDEEGRLASAVLEFAAVWANDRGMTVNSSDGEERLVLRAAPGESRSVVLTRDGWSFEGAASELREATVPSRVWLQNADAQFVRWSPGLVECGLERPAKLGGDPAAFAVSWAELFDSALMPSSEVVALEERVSAGDPTVHVPGAWAGGEREAQAAVLPAAWFATAAFLCAAVASALGLRKRVRSQPR